MRYCDNKICPDKRTDEQTIKCGGRTAQKHNVFADMSVSEVIIKGKIV